MVNGRARHRRRVAPILGCWASLVDTVTRNQETDLRGTILIVVRRRPVLVENTERKSQRRIDSEVGISLQKALLVG